jgi:hypothetical protein
MKNGPQQVGETERDAAWWQRPFGFAQGGKKMSWVVDRDCAMLKCKKQLRRF